MNKEIEKIEQFKTGDGNVFNTLEEAEVYNILLKKCDDVSSTLISFPEDDEDFYNGVGWIQHLEGTKKNLEKFILEMYFELNPDVPVETELTYNIYEAFADKNTLCLFDLIYRWKCMSEDDREYGQPYFVRNVHHVTGGQIN